MSRPWMHVRIARGTLLAALLLWCHAHASEETTGWAVIPPSEAPQGRIRDRSGQWHVATGPGAAEWFVADDAGLWKVYALEPKEPVYVELWAAPSAAGDRMLGDLHMMVEVRDGQRWRPVVRYRGPIWEGDLPRGEPAKRLLYVPPGHAALRLNARGSGCYARVLQRTPLARERQAPPEDDLEPSIEKLGSANPSERDAAHQTLRDAGESARPLLERARSSEDPEVALRAATLLAELDRPAAWLTEHQMKVLRGMIVSGLRAVLGSAKGRENEVKASIVNLGPPALPEILDEMSRTKRPASLAVFYDALGEIGDSRAIETCIEGLEFTGIPDTDPKAAAAVRRKAWTALRKITGRKDIPLEAAAWRAALKPEK